MVLHCIVLYSIVLYCIVLYCIVIQLSVGQEKGTTGPSRPLRNTSLKKEVFEEGRGAFAENVRRK